MPKIVVTNDQRFSVAQKQRLESLGEVTYYTLAASRVSIGMGCYI